MEKNNFINSFDELNKEFDALNGGYGNYCNDCNRPDCEGFIWLLESEAALYESKNINTITLNDDINFISCFNQDSDDLSLDIVNPKCIYRCEETKRCTIHDVRPLTCHMYPVGPETINGKDYWIVHTDCEWIQHLIKENRIEEFILSAKNLFNRIDGFLYSKLVLTYEKMNSISVETDMDDSEYLIISEM